MLLRLAWISVLFSGCSIAGITWTSIWLEPRKPVVLTVGESKPYTVMGRNFDGLKADLTKSPYLEITSSDPGIVEVDPASGAFVGKKAGHAEITISFGDLTEMIAAFVRPAITDTTSGVDGVWNAVFTGDWGERPKMVSEIAFELDSRGGALKGMVHAAYWPGDAAISDGSVTGDRVTFSMTGHLPYQAGRPDAMVTGFPKLCFTGVRNGGEMKIELRWTDASRPCEEGKVLPMTGKKIAD